MTPALIASDRCPVAWDKARTEGRSGDPGRTSLLNTVEMKPESFRGRMASAHDKAEGTQQSTPLSTWCLTTTSRIYGKNREVRHTTTTTQKKKQIMNSSS